MHCALSKCFDRASCGKHRVHWFRGTAVVALYELDIEKEGRKEMFYITTHSTHFIYGYMASDIW